MISWLACPVVAVTAAVVKLVIFRLNENPPGLKLNVPTGEPTVFLMNRMVPVVGGANVSVKVQVVVWPGEIVIPVRLPACRLAVQL